MPDDSAKTKSKKGAKTKKSAKALETRARLTAPQRETRSRCMDLAAAIERAERRKANSVDVDALRADLAQRNDTLPRWARVGG